MSTSRLQPKELTDHRLRIGNRSVTLVEGPAGWGECSPLAGYPCDPTRARRAADEAATLPWPAPVRDRVAVNALVDGAGFDPDALRGYSCVKVKVGYPGDVEVVAAVRDAVGPRVALRVDANGAWDVDTTLARIGALSRYDLELVEQPVPTLDELAEVRRRSPVPVAADECVRDTAAAHRLRALAAADAIVLKLQPLGGFRAALDVAAAAGVPAIVTSMMETSVGIAAGLALAAALPELPYACGLATVPFLDGDVTHAPLVADDGELRVRRVVPDPDCLARYADPSQGCTT